jgi:hypothetical protein
MPVMQHRRSRYIGLDAHRATVGVAIAEEDGPPSSYGTIANDPTAIRKLMTRLGGPEVHLRVAYEAGPTGYALHRQTDRAPAHRARHAPSVSDALKRRQAHVPPTIVELAWRAQLRLHARYRHLGARLGPYKAVMAVARELAGFIWAAGKLLHEQPAAA